MKQYEAVVQVMIANGGYATLGQLYLKTLKIPNVEWKTKTPFASIRRIVQDTRFFFKIRPGLWALKGFEKTVLKNFNIEKSKDKKENFSHTYFQGLLLEIGNLKGFYTYVPAQDKNKLFLDKPLCTISNILSIFEFSYSEVVNRARAIDVIWFNQRKLPSSFFEVEHSTDIQNALLKFFDLQDFHSNFYIVSAIERKKEFENKISHSAFKDIKDRIKFIDYDFVSNLHTKSFEIATMGTL